MENEPLVRGSLTKPRMGSPAHTDGQRQGRGVELHAGGGCQVVLRLALEVLQHLKTLGLLTQVPDLHVPHQEEQPLPGLRWSDYGDMRLACICEPPLQPKEVRTIMLFN